MERCYRHLKTKEHRHYLAKATPNDATAAIIQKSGTPSLFRDLTFREDAHRPYRCFLYRSSSDPAITCANPILRKQILTARG